MQNLFGRSVIYTSSYDLDINLVVKAVNGAIQVKKPQHLHKLQNPQKNKSLS